jgi:hypothetical protein
MPGIEMNPLSKNIDWRPIPMNPSFNFSSATFCLQADSDENIAIPATPIAAVPRKWRLETPFFS